MQKIKRAMIAALAMVALSGAAQATPVFDSQLKPVTATKAAPYSFTFDLTDNGFSLGDILTSAAIDLWASTTSPAFKTFDFLLGDGADKQTLSFNTKDGSPQRFALTQTTLDDLAADGKIKMTYNPTKGDGTLTVNAMLTANVQDPAPTPTGSEVPEPTSVALMGLGLLGLASLAKRRRA